MATVTEREPRATPERPARTKRTRRDRRATSLAAHGEPMVWITGGALALALAMILGLFTLVVVEGFATFWPGDVESASTWDGRELVGEVTKRERYTPDAATLARMPAEERARAQALLDAQGGTLGRTLLRTGNFELTGTHYTWVSDHEVRLRSLPASSLVVERNAWGRFYGNAVELRVGDQVVAREGADVLAAYERYHGECRARLARRIELERDAVGDLNAELEDLRLELRHVELAQGAGSAEYAAEEKRLAPLRSDVEARFGRVESEIAGLNTENARYQLVLQTADGKRSSIALADVVRLYPANALDTLGRIRVYLSRWREFLTDVPRQANSEGGVFPAIFGTVVMTLAMSILVVPFGVLAALYLREYAKQGVLVGLVRIAVNNLAGVPSIVFGIFGLGFFCYTLGASIDQVLFAEKLPNPTYGKGGLLWASFTLALLTLPVVIVATEEALAAVPSSMREGSYACGATKWQTIRRIVLPRALPGILTGTILAIARGAGEVAPIMLVGAVKLAPRLVVDGAFPFVHPERSFMHLGFHIWDLGFQAQNSEAAKPMVFTTTLLLVLVIVSLNVTALWVRGRLRGKYSAAHA